MPLLYGCPKKSIVTTRINTDGSCTRTVGMIDPRDFKGIDSVRHDLPVSIDHSWEFININDSTALFQKQYNSIDELNSLYAHDESEFGVYKRSVGLEKNFRWFYTEFIYHETFGGILTKVPLSNYMSEEEIQLIKMDDSEKHPLVMNMNPKARQSLIDNIDERAGFWIHDNLFEIVFEDILEIAYSSSIINRDKINVGALKDSIKVQIKKYDKVLVSFDFDDDAMDMIDLARLVGENLKLDSLKLIQLVNIVELADLESRYDTELFAGFDDYNNHVFMPGQLTDTNADEIRSDTLHWDIGFIKFMDDDYTLYAESKVTNTWAYMVSGFVLAIALITPFLRKKKP